MTTPHRTKRQSKAELCYLQMVLAVLFLTACAGPSLRQDVERPEPSFAQSPASSGMLAEISNRIREKHGADHSGFYLLDGSHDALTWRLALIDSAVSSLDILTYLWYPDVAGELILERAVLAARRGVRVRLIVDDLLTIGQDQVLANIQSHDNIELRLFNPWHRRDLGSRGAEMIAEMERLNVRMHDKLIIADGHATIAGGRNIGDHYFGLHDSYNFRDLDVLAIGHLAQEANGMFDHFWNSSWMESAANLTTSPDPEQAKSSWQRLQERTRQAEELESFARKPRDWSGDFADIESQLKFGTGYLVFDEVSADEVDQFMISTMFAIFELAQEELLITNAYIIPGQPSIDFLQGLTNSGVDIRILTNSLASHDVPAVNSHYEKWRKPIINAGVELYEMRSDPEIQSEVDVPPVSAKFAGLHTKAAVIDGRFVFIGSMNLDPRSAQINTEMGAVIDSVDLAQELRAIMLRDMRGENAWHVSISEDGRLQWANTEEIVDSQPTRDVLQNIMNVIFKVVPKEQF